jgi:hypothetical protein
MVSGMSEGATDAVNAAAKSSSVPSLWRSRCGIALARVRTFSFSNPGTSHSVRPAGTWFSSASGTFIVTPSRGEPGSNWYSSG